VHCTKQKKGNLVFGSGRFSNLGRKTGKTGEKQAALARLDQGGGKNRPPTVKWRDSESEGSN